MLYPNNIEQKIGFSDIRTLLRDHCTFSLGREEADAITYLTDFQAITHLLAEGREMLNILQDGSLAFPHCELHDLRDSLSRVRIDGLFLDEDELYALRKALDAVLQNVLFFDSLPIERFPVLHGLAPAAAPDEDVPIKDILRELDRILDKYGKLRDNASPELARIRRELNQAQGSVSRALASILRQAQADGLIAQDVTPTMREGRMVIPVPPAYKRRLGGIVHDESATGKTVYVEPQQVVEANNHIRELEGDERRERARILLDFTAYLRPFAPGIKNSQFFLGHVDFLRAKARLAIDLKAIAPELHPHPLIDLHEARHPLLYLNFKKQNREVVPLTISLEKNSRILIISGPNAGGKSVCLKTVVLLQYMLQCGLLIPVREDSRCGLFDSLFIDIGDEQSIEDDLSTYSSHLSNMKAFVRGCNQSSLFLIDEFGGGTEPLLGGAIAEAVLNKLTDSGAFGVITTHYTNLKHFADNHPGVINGAMLYDRGALKPLFMLSIGQPGSSFAIEIARQIGLPEDIILQAKELVGEDNIQYDRSLQDIARDKRYWAEKRKEVHQKEKQLTELKSHYEQEIQGIRQKRKEVLLKAKEDAAEMLRQSNRTIENTIRQIKESGADKERTKQARQKVENLKESIQTSLAKKQPPKNAAPVTMQAESQELKVGVKVRIRGQEAIGEIVSMTDKQAVVAYGNLQSRVPLKKLDYVSNRAAKKAEAHSALTHPMYSAISDALRAKKLAFRDELDIRGYRADEALQEVMNYVDDAIMVGASEVRVLHGTGTGALKQVVRDYLRQQHRVTSFHDGDPDKGGAGITIIEF